MACTRTVAAVAAAVVVAVGLALGFGTLMTHNTNEVQIAKVQACRSLPVAERAACITPSEPTTRTEQCRQVADTAQPTQYPQVFRECMARGRPWHFR